MAMVKLRRIVGALVFLAFVALFSGLEWRVIAWIAPLAKLQYAPAVLAGNVVVAVAITTVAVLNGRFYCSVLCPLGLFQDFASIPGRLVRRLLKRPPPRVGPAVRRAQFVVRHAVLAAFLAVGLCGLGFSWIEPYGIFGRATVLWSGAALAAVIAALAMAGRGRAWCSWVCPVGTFLGLFSRIAPFRLRIDGSKCVGCRKCERRCKAGAISIDGRGGEVDASLCVFCLDCVAECPTTAISSRRAAKRNAANEGKSGESMSRKGFIVGTAAAGAALAAEAAPEEKTVDGGFAEVVPPGIDERKIPLKPAGSRSLANFTTRCVGCQLCVKACPNRVLRPSRHAKGRMQPEMAFDRGYCTVDCTRCGEVCPAGAIAPLAGVKKENVSIGHAVWHEKRCVAAAEGVNCTACERHCPVKAIVRVKSGGSAMVPVVDEGKCIGCGACEHVCPSRPMPGMVVEGRERHVEIRGVVSAALACCLLAFGAFAQEGEGVVEADDFARAYVGAAGAMTLPQGGASHMRRLGGLALRGGWYATDFLAVEGEAAWLENAAGLAAQGLWHWQGADLYGRFFGYSAFDPFFTFGARGWIGDGLGQVGPKAGVGAFWHLTDSWSLRADADATLGLDSGVDVLYSVALGVQFAF